MIRENLNLATFAARGCGAVNEYIARATNDGFMVWDFGWLDASWEQHENRSAENMLHASTESAVYFCLFYNPLTYK